MYDSDSFDSYFCCAKLLKIIIFYVFLGKKKVFDSIFRRKIRLLISFFCNFAN